MRTAFYVASHAVWVIIYLNNFFSHEKDKANDIYACVSFISKCMNVCISVSQVFVCLQGVERKISKANHLMENMSMQHVLWKSELKTAKNKIKTSPSDALITAACICYHGPLDNRTRAELMHDWLNRCEMGNFDPSFHLGRQVKPVSLSAKIDRLMKPGYMTESVHSIQHGDTYPAGEALSHRDDVSSVHESLHERASSASSMPQMNIYKHQPSIYDTGISFKTEIRVLDPIDAVPINSEVDSIDASSVSSKNLLAVRENFTLQDVLSSFEELSIWKLKNLPTDVYSIHNALLMRVSCKNRLHCWPLLVDPDNKAEMWVRVLQGSQNIISDPNPRNHTIGTCLFGIDNIFHCYMYDITWGQFQLYCSDNHCVTP